MSDFRARLLESSLSDFLPIPDIPLPPKHSHSTSEPRHPKPDIA